MNKILTYLLCFITFGISAQVQITGKVIDKETKLPIEFAEVVLTNENSTTPVGVITSELGAFELKVNSGISYTLQVFYIGEVLYTQEITPEKNINLGIIEVENSQQLEEVIVAAKKKLIHRKIDRLVFNVENSTKASEGDALEVLKVTPGVRVQNDRISMIGKSNLQVMIDDKIVQLSNEDLTNFLKSISSEDIKDIEVITMPPAKYEASGNSGLINIKFKKAKADSWSMLLRGSYRQRTEGGGGVLGNFNYSKNKFSLAASLSYNDRMWHKDQDVETFFTDGRWITTSPFDAEITYTSGRVDMGYQFTDKWSSGIQYLYNKFTYFQDNTPFTNVLDYNTQQQIRFQSSRTQLDIKSDFNSINYYNIVELDSLGKKMVLNMDYFNYENNNIKFYDGTSVINLPDVVTEYFKGENGNRQKIRNVALKLDFDYPLEWATLSFGGKITSSKSTNDISLFNSGLVSTPILQDSPLEFTDFEYKENIQALYASANKKFNDKWQMQLGIRMETTQTKSFSSSLSLQNDYDYVKFFPTVYLANTPNENHTFTLSYSKRIERPGFLELNPNIFFLNPFLSVEGNPFLQPSFIDNLEFSHSYKDLNSKLYYSYEDNAYGQIALPDDNTNITNFTNRNYIKAHRFGINENYIYNRIPWWTSNNSFDLSYSIASFFNIENELPNNKGFNARISTNNDFILTSNKNLMLNINYWYDFPGVDGVFDLESMQSLSLSLHWHLLDKNLKISLKGNDIFKGQIERATATVNNIFQKERYYNDSRSVQLTVAYKFGNKNLKVKKNTSGSEEEKRRTGN